MGVNQGKALFANRRQLNSTTPTEPVEGSTLDRKAARDGFTNTEPTIARGTELFDRAHPTHAAQKGTA